MRSMKRNLRNYGAHLVLNEKTDPFLTGAVMGTLAALLDPPKKKRTSMTGKSRKRRY